MLVEPRWRLFEDGLGELAQIEWNTDDSQELIVITVSKPSD
jgi:hypothetical protein